MKPSILFKSIQETKRHAQFNIFSLGLYGFIFLIFLFKAHATTPESKSEQRPNDFDFSVLDTLPTFSLDKILNATGTEMAKSQVIVQRKIIHELQHSGKTTIFIPQNAILQNVFTGMSYKTPRGIYANVIRQPDPQGNFYIYSKNEKIQYKIASSLISSPGETGQLHPWPQQLNIHKVVPRSQLPQVQIQFTNVFNLGLEFVSSQFAQINKDSDSSAALEQNSPILTFKDTLFTKSNLPFEVGPAFIFTLASSQQGPANSVQQKYFYLGPFFRVPLNFISLQRSYINLGGATRIFKLPTQNPSQDSTFIDLGQNLMEIDWEYFLNTSLFSNSVISLGIKKYWPTQKNEKYSAAPTTSNNFSILISWGLSWGFQP